MYRSNFYCCCSTSTRLESYRCIWSLKYFILKYHFGKWVIQFGEWGNWRHWRRLIQSIGTNGCSNFVLQPDLRLSSASSWKSSAADFFRGGFIRRNSNEKMWRNLSAAELFRQNKLAKQLSAAEYSLRRKLAELFRRGTLSTAEL